jgi:hypothetical protein
MRLANEEDLREDLELTVIELRSLGVAASSIRRYVNAATRATGAAPSPTCGKGETAGQKSPTTSHYSPMLWVFRYSSAAP